MEAYPAVQNTLRTALKAAFPENNYPSAKDIIEANIPYLSAVCQEIFRLGGIAKGSLRQATKDTEILGYKIPKGAEVYMNYHLNHTTHAIDDSKRTPSGRTAAVKFKNELNGIAGRDIQKFEPARWLTKDPDTGEERFNAHALPLLAFGAGFRGCPGKKT
jgi:cytochrome P450